MSYCREVIVFYCFTNLLLYSLKAVTNGSYLPWKWRKTQKVGDYAINQTEANTFFKRFKRGRYEPEAKHSVSISIQMLCFKRIRLGIHDIQPI